MINWEHLDNLLPSLQEKWRESNGVRFVEIDDFLAPDCIQSLADFSCIDDKLTQPIQRKHKHVRGKTGTDQSRMQAQHFEFFRQVNGERFLRYLEALVHQKPLYPDDDLFGGGLHIIKAGGYLNVHTDFNQHPVSKRQRALNLLVYLNEEWQESWGGHIELWSADMRMPVFKAKPMAGKAILFETTENSFHGHPTPMTPPPGVTRKSLAVYYYADWQEELDARSKTNYQLTPTQWGTLFQRAAGHLETGKSDDEIVALLYCDYQTADIRAALKTLLGMRSAVISPEKYLEKANGEVEAITD